MGFDFVIGFKDSCCRQKLELSILLNIQFYPQVKNPKAQFSPTLFGIEGRKKFIEALSL
jgi:hypothetical protein